MSADRRVCPRELRSRRPWRAAQNVKKPISVECAIACAKGGSPLVILTEDGHIYWPISGKTPATGQNSRLLKFAGQKVIVTGKIYDRDGTHAIVIDTVEGEAAGK